VTHSPDPATRPTPFLRRLGNLYLLRRPRRLPRLRTTWPDFAELEVEIVEARIVHLLADGTEKLAGFETMIQFPDLLPPVALKRGLLDTFEEYILLAKIAFYERYPDHTYSENLREQLPGLTQRDMVRLLRDRKAFQAWRQATDVTAAMLLGAARVPPKSPWPVRVLEGILTALFFVLIYGGALLALIYALAQ
jgi:hypothetical protein